jgi:hypothetical protein
VVPALVGLAGVVVGVLLTGFNAYRAERAEARRKARASARLLQAELWAIAGRARLLAEELKEHGDRDAWLKAETALSTLPESRLWADHQAVLAATLSTDDWGEVSGAYRSLDLLKAQAPSDQDWEQLHDGSLLGRALWSRFVIGSFVDGLEHGALALAKLAGAPTKRSPGDELDRLLGVVSSSDTRYSTPRNPEATP